ncbi:hypothetical protein [Nonomuraea endophytica]|uniref:Putative ATPase n=1 Tax=Nonomuraea endophytica TaxID=714136 RepID=A0A7W8A2Y3_9ACTN|nr:hypothetical protein [Nonomuraea endophytica]MBB5078542.1 putative ATPase [Nonomuraea endophytica]
MTFGCAGKLPDEDAGFIGRLGVLATLRRHVAEARLVTVTGIGGVGKTRTALRLAHERRDRHQGGVWFADVSAVTDPCLVRPMIEAALGTGSLSGWAGGRRGLLVLDGCERVAPVCAQVAGELLRAAPGLHVLVTSRVPLGVPDERVVALAPMETAGADNEAVRLFAARAREVQPGFELDELTVTSVAELCARLDGIPLAIELAALRLTSMTVNGVAAGLKDRFALLTGPADGRSLHDSLTRSYDLCEPAERLLWAQLSVFAGDFDLEAARFVCGEEIDGLVEALVDKSVLLIRTDYPGTRYKLLGTLAEYGATRLDDSRQIRHRHLLYYLGLATRSDQDWSGPRQMYWFERMRQEHDNVRVALEHALHTPDEAGLALRLLSSLWFMWVCCGFAGEGRKYLERALDANPEPSRERCKAMWVLSYVRSAQGDSMGAMSMAELCGEEARQINDTKAMILSSKMRGTAALLQGDLEQASELLGVAIEFIAESGELNPGLLPAVVEQSIVLTKQGGLEEAESLLLECLLTCEERGELFVGSYAYWALADARLAMGRCQAALDDVRKALRLKRQFHDILGMLIALETAAGIYAALGQPTVSVRLLGALEENWKAAGLPMLGAPWLTDDHEALTRKCREALGEDAYQEAFDSGMLLDLAWATALALGTRTAGELTELKIRVADPAGAALTEAAVERVARAFGFTMLVEEGDGGTAYGLRPRDDGEDVPAEQRLEEMDSRLREDPPREPSVARLFTVLRTAGPAVVLIERTLIVHAQGKITTRRLSSAEQAFLHSRPRLFDDPDGLVAEFRQLAAESAVDASPQPGRDYDQGIAAELGVPVAVAIKGWGDPEGLEITLNTPVWTKRGYTDCSLAALLIKPLPGTSTPPRKVIAKVCPPGPLSREYSRHRLALEVSVPGFRDKHLVGLLPHPPYIARHRRVCLLPGARRRKPHRHGADGRAERASRARPGVPARHQRRHVRVEPVPARGARGPGFGGIPARRTGRPVRRRREAAHLGTRVRAAGAGAELDLVLRRPVRESAAQPPGHGRRDRRRPPPCPAPAGLLPWRPPPRKRPGPPRAHGRAQTRSVPAHRPDHVREGRFAVPGPGGAGSVAHRQADPAAPGVPARPDRAGQGERQPGGAPGPRPVRRQARAPGLPRRLAPPAPALPAGRRADPLHLRRRGRAPQVVVLPAGRPVWRRVSAEHLVVGTVRDGGAPAASAGAHAGLRDA